MPRSAFRAMRHLWGHAAPVYLSSLSLPGGAVNHAAGYVRAFVLAHPVQDARRRRFGSDGCSAARRAGRGDRPWPGAAPLAHERSDSFGPKPSSRTPSLCVADPRRRAPAGPWPCRHRRSCIPRTGPRPWRMAATGRWQLPWPGGIEASAVDPRQGNRFEGLPIGLLHALATTRMPRRGRDPSDPLPASQARPEPPAAVTADPVLAFVRPRHTPAGVSRLLASPISRSTMTQSRHTPSRRAWCS